MARYASVERQARALALYAALACGALGASRVAAGPSAAEVNQHSQAAHELEGRLIAPCCWTQTLDIHDSPIAEQLRADIVQRLKAHEPAAKIEDELARRYGERIRAVPRGEDPRVALPIIVGSAMCLTIACLFWFGAAWLRRSRADSPTTMQGKQPYDEQLDRELKDLSDIS